jgi:hypothetical protein
MELNIAALKASKPAFKECFVLVIMPDNSAAWANAVALHLRVQDRTTVTAAIQRNSITDVVALHSSQVESSEVILRPTVSRSVCLGVRHPSQTSNHFFPFFLKFFLDSYGFSDVGRPLWREVGSVFFSFSWASPAQPFSTRSPTDLMSIFYCLYFWDSPNLVGQVPVFISPRNRVAQLYPQKLGLHCIVRHMNISSFYLWSTEHLSQ